ncbi:hypothetical protein HDU87_004847 [Geranomyces variabilis]|uniref:Transmembrane protein 135 N-terminal domain-containing protein n=1 Tax=Geranomyces variabilis TaxID=109894 RepID=A0AAD5TN14_9FUNG|nr:hypothetical protein HDU87_004847 [Geranomyces variabilis]
MPVRAIPALPALKLSGTASAPRELVAAAAPELESQKKSLEDDGNIGKKPKSPYRAPIVPPTWLGHKQILFHATTGGLRSFLLAYGMRGGIAFLIKFIAILSGRATFRAALKSFFATTSLRFASTVGSFSFLWKLINNTLAHHSPRPSKWHGAIAGAVAGGVSILCEAKETRVAFAQQFAVRAMQAGYGALKQRGVVNFQHGDSALFMFSCSCIMYAYIISPHTIPREYYSWMVKIAGMPAAMLSMNRTNIRAFARGTTHPSPLDAIANLAKVHKHRSGFVPVEALTAPGGVLAEFAKSGKPLAMVPCEILHPGPCTQYNAHLALRVMKDIMPVYAALNFVPMLLLKTKSFVNNPATLTIRHSLATIRSTLFLMAFIIIFQGGICVQRNTAMSAAAPAFLRRDWKGVYYALGAICASSIFIEQKSRRSELAMYVLPKGLGSLWTVLEDRRLVKALPHFEVLMASGAMGMLMSLYQMEPQHMSSLLYKVMSKVIGRY